ncbi:glutathione S-transferase [Marinomonas gallaica]|uniref:glutathione S-transferase n=1 Tax=Marinomonas gallaica TaxID=1806667 RepID=UPI000830824C|nr:glutathione S-transferase [Marinomonas gallaica]
MSAVLYSFRRCPYAIRARYTLATLMLRVEIREVVLKHKPADLLALGGRSTVPQLLVDGDRFPESLDIIFWALKTSSNDDLVSQLWPTDPTLRAKIMSWIRFNDHCFKPWLDRYKYADRHPEQPESYYRTKGECFLKRLDTRLKHSTYLLGEQMTIADIAVFPFVRQFSGVNPDWFESSEYLYLKNWLNRFLKSDCFDVVMKKLPAWNNDQEGITYFPELL